MISGILGFLWNEEGGACFQGTDPQSASLNVPYDKEQRYTVKPRNLELTYFKLTLILKWKSGPCFNMKLWQQVTK